MRWNPIARLRMPCQRDPCAYCVTWTPMRLRRAARSDVPINQSSSPRADGDGVEHGVDRPDTVRARETQRGGGRIDGQIECPGRVEPGALERAGEVTCSAARRVGPTREGAG